MIIPMDSENAVDGALDSLEGNPHGASHAPRPNHQVHLGPTDLHLVQCLNAPQTRWPSHSYLSSELPILDSRSCMAHAPKRPSAAPEAAGALRRRFLGHIFALHLPWSAALIPADAIFETLPPPHTNPHQPEAHPLAYDQEGFMRGRC